MRHALAGVVTPSPYTPTEPDWAQAVAAKASANYRFATTNRYLLRAVFTRAVLTVRPDKSTWVPPHYYPHAASCGFCEYGVQCYWYIHSRSRQQYRAAVWVVPDGRLATVDWGDRVRAVRAVHARDAPREGISGMYFVGRPMCSGVYHLPEVLEHVGYELAERLAAGDLAAWSDAYNSPLIPRRLRSSVRGAADALAETMRKALANLG